MTLPKKQVGSTVPRRFPTLSLSAAGPRRGAPFRATATTSAAAASPTARPADDEDLGLDGKPPTTAVEPRPTHPLPSPNIKKTLTMVRLRGIWLRRWNRWKPTVIERFTYVRLTSRVAWLVMRSFHWLKYHGRFAGSSKCLSTVLEKRQSKDRFFPS
jgi:hypothetical protein